MRTFVTVVAAVLGLGALAGCSGDDAPSCGASTCGACAAGCTPMDRCESGAWVCQCVCMDAAGTDAGGGDSGAPMDAARADDAAMSIDSGALRDAAMSVDAPVVRFDAADCSAASAAATAFIAANKDCVSDTDCTQVVAPCYSMTEDCCVVYMKTGYDLTAWSSIYDAVTSCSGGACGCCAAIPAPPGCIMGHCGPRR